MKQDGFPITYRGDHLTSNEMHLKPFPLFEIKYYF